MILSTCTHALSEGEAGTVPQTKVVHLVWSRITFGRQPCDVSRIA